MSEKQFIYFNARVKISDRNKLTRDNYCVFTTKVTKREKSGILFARDFFEKNNRYPVLCPMEFRCVPNEIYADEEHYTNKWAEQHYNDCMENYDLNMKYFESLNREDFCEYLNSFQKKNKLLEIFNLNEVNGKEGIYILVLDEYKQVYIGQSYDIKKRILAHWRAKKEFAQLIWGNVDDSIISIDSFGALDTTRIFYKLVSNRKINEVERKLVKSFDKTYLLNRASGGLNGIDDIYVRNLSLFANKQKRKLKI